MKNVLIMSSFLLILNIFITAFSQEKQDIQDSPPVFKFQVKKGLSFKYLIRADITRETRIRDDMEKVLSRVEDVLEFEMKQTCTSVEENGNMVFEIDYDNFKLVRNVFEGSFSRKEVYTPENFSITDDKGITIIKKWNEMPLSEQTEFRKLFVQGFSFTATPNGEIIEKGNISYFDRELPGFNTIRIMNAVYYHGQPMEEGTIWNWKKIISFPKTKDHPLSEKKIPTEYEYEFIELKEVSGIPCATISIKIKSDLKNIEEDIAFLRQLTAKTHIETANGVPVHTEGTIQSSLSYSGLSKGIEIATNGNFIIKRLEKR